MNVTIEKIEINSFGKLKNATITAKSGINILSAPNESGKSTVASFIKFVFYGFAGARMQSLSDNERRLYTPWDGEISEGTIYIVADGKSFSVHRRCLASGKDTCEVINRSTGKPEFFGEIPGEVFFGVSEEVFARTLFFRQLTTPQSKDDILADRLRNIAISADEQVGTKKAVTRLNECKNELKGRLGNGLIPKAEKERDALEESITAAIDTRREAIRLGDEVKKRNDVLDGASEKLDDLHAERRNIEKYEAKIKLRNIERLSLDERNAREEYEAVSAGLKKREDGAFNELFQKNTEYVAECRDCENIGKTLSAAEAERESLLDETVIDGSEVKRAQRILDSSKRNSSICFYGAGIAVVIGAILAFASSATMGFGIVLAALGIILTVVGFVSLSKPSNLVRELGFENLGELRSAINSYPMLEKQLHDVEARIKALRENFEESRTKCAILKRELDAGIGNYIDVSDENYSEQLRLVLAKSSESGEKLAVWRAKKEELDNATKDCDPVLLAEEARDAREPDREKAKVDREISFYTTQFNQLSDLNRRDELEIAALEARGGDPAAMVGKRDALNARIDDLAIKYKAYETAVRVIEEASDYMKSMVAPRIGERADEYFTAATGGKYKALEIDTKLSMSFGEDMRRSCDYLSAGTRDSAYLSLRLALADMLFGGCGVPMLLDDAFVRIDDIRLRMMSGALNEAAKKHQLFILTHSDREMRAFEEIGVDYNQISIKTE